jgi:hypothetical protein
MNKIVPIELNKSQKIAMINAYEDSMGGDRLPDGDGYDEVVVSNIHKAMLSAAPESDHIIASRAEWQAAMESQWISVDDRLPDTDQTALTYDKDCKEIRTTWFADWRDIKNFQWLSHWMPLPQPPKEKL